MTINKPGQEFIIKDTHPGLWYEETHSFLYRDGRSVDLGNFGWPLYQVTSVNSSGQMVGWAETTAGGDQIAFTYCNGAPSDLNTFIPSTSGWMRGAATCINDAGQIVGWGYHNGAERAVLLSPVPEPSTLALLAIGAIGLLAYGWRKRNPRTTRHLAGGSNGLQD